VIDSRTDEEFLGWQLYGEARGGHITNAVQLPYAWFYNTDKTTLSYQDLKSLFESRGITPDKEVTAYCTAGIRSGYVYFLRLMGYTRCSNYDASIWDG
jgi:thiosulfate/3-mercaptopyruvate sulfurtransferase